MTELSAQVAARYRTRQAHVVVIGLGYVGLPLAVAMAKAGYRVTGLDIDQARVAALNNGISPVEDITDAALHTILAPTENRHTFGTFHATGDFDTLRTCDAVSICVPTPLNKVGEPDLTYILDAADQIARHLHPGVTVVLESTTYPGTTSEVLRSRIEENPSGLRVGESVFLAFSPERIDPGRTDWTIESMPKVIGGVTPACLMAASALYEGAVGPLTSVSSADAAELVKLFENTFRSVNIALANELLLMCDKLGLNAWEVLDAAATKPFGFMKFTPGPGLGGHCIPVDPHYLSWKLRTLDYNARFIELASEINTEMPRYWVQKCQDALNDASKPVKGSTLLILGVAYKKDVSDLRESPALDIIQLLQAKGALVSYHDPYVPSLSVGDVTLSSITNLPTALQASDCVVIVTDHSAYDWQLVAQASQLIVDTRNVLASKSAA